MSENVHVERHDRVCLVRMHRPEKKNALTADMYEAMADALEAADADPGTRVVVLAGAGGAFTAGNDIADFLERPPRSQRDPVYRFIYRLPATRTPIVAAVDGLAVGIGTTMLLHCDLVYATPRARFILPFVDLGLVPEAASSLLLPALAGRQRASELLLLGEPFDAETGRAIGLVNEVCEPDALEARALETAAKLAAKPRDALLAAKALIRRDAETVEARMHAELMEFAALLESPQAKEAFTAFLERRKPDFASLDD